MQTCWWPLSDHWSVQPTSPHLSGFVFYGCLESLTELSALCISIELQASNVTNGFDLHHNLDLWILKVKRDLDLWPHTWPWPWIFMVKFWNSRIPEWEGRLTLHKGGGSRSFMTMTMTIWWPRSGVWIYQIVTGVTSVVCVPSTHLVNQMSIIMFFKKVLWIHYTKIELIKWRYFLKLCQWQIYVLRKEEDVHPINIIWGQNIFCPQNAPLNSYSVFIKTIFILSTVTDMWSGRCPPPLVWADGHIFHPRLEINLSIQWHDERSLRHCDVVWWLRSWSTLAQVMACCLMAPSHYLNQYWLIGVKGKFCDVHLRAILMNLFRKMCSDITVF